MTNDSVKEAIAQAERFIAAARAIQWDHRGYLMGTVESAAARRASMDLTRALARMRRY